MKHILSSIMLMILTISVAYAGAAKVVNVKGSVDVLPAGTYSWESVEQGRLLDENDRVRTGPAAALKVKLENGTELSVGANATFEMSALVPEESKINLIIGKLKATVKKLQPREKFSVTTPATVCSVRGTEFSVEVLDNAKTIVDVFSGIVATQMVGGEEIMVHPNERIEYQIGLPPVQSTISSGESGASLTQLSARQEVEQEMRLDMTKEEVQAAAAIEMQQAEYQLGKTCIDAFGYRVRMDEYILRPQPDTMKLVVLNERDNRYDWYKYSATYNDTLPTNLADINNSFVYTSLKDTVNGKDYYVTSYEKGMSNTKDWIKETADRTTFGGGTTWANYCFNVHGYTKGDTILRKIENGVETIRNISTADPPYTTGTETNEKGVEGTFTRYGLTNTYSGSYYKQTLYLIDDEGKNTSDGAKMNGEMVYTSDRMDDKIDIMMDPKILPR